MTCFGCFFKRCQMHFATTNTKKSFRMVWECLSTSIFVAQKRTVPHSATPTVPSEHTPQQSRAWAEIHDLFELFEPKTETEVEIKGFICAWMCLAILSAGPSGCCQSKSSSMLHRSGCHHSWHSKKWRFRSQQSEQLGLPSKKENGGV